MNEHLYFARAHHFGRLDIDDYEKRDWWRARHEAHARYGWAIPDDRAIEILVGHGPLIELGAGLGYWASLVEKAGGDIVCYDAHPPVSPEHRNGWCKETKRSGGLPDVVGLAYVTVRKGRVRVPLLRHPRRTLFISWPPYDMPFARRALAAYRGQTFIYVGEGDGGCNGDDGFWRLLDREWTRTNTHDLPQWDCLHDYLSVWTRNQ